MISFKYRGREWSLGVFISPEQDYEIQVIADNALVYDPFMGSGTTAKMAHILNRKWVGSEISQQYCELAQRRLKPYLNKLDL